MAISNTHVHIEVPGAAKEALAEVTLDNNYPTGGYAFSPALFGFSILRFAVPVTTNQGYVAILDQANQKVKIFKNATGAGKLIEETGGTDLSTVKVYFLVRGF